MQFNGLDDIDSPKDLRKLNISDLKQVCSELREYIIDKVQIHGGHFSANLGTVELTIALHYIFNTPEDQLIWDVGHQAYGHKIITGRRSDFSTIRKKDGLSGFPNPSESEFDHFLTGHSSTSISLALGLAEADKLNGIDRCHIAVIGDGSMTAGMAWEALNNAGVSDSNLIVVLNDNQMGIDPNEGSISKYLASLDSSQRNVFQDLGFEYYGKDDGHDILSLINSGNKIKKSKKPRIWHVKTIKGKGFAPAEAEQTKWHAVKYVKLDTDPPEPEGPKYQEVFGKTLLELARLNNSIVGVTPAMPSGSSMNIMMKEMPERVFDVGIAEQHAITFSAGLAKNGLKPFCHIYSTFLQRGYDQVIHDVCLQNLPVVFCIDRAGAAGEDGSTHQGMFDLAFLNCIPNLTIAVPSNETELRNLMYYSTKHKTPIVIRYPKDSGTNPDWQIPFELNFDQNPRCVQSGEKIAVIVLGTLLSNVVEASKHFSSNQIEIIDLRFLKPLDEEVLKSCFNRFENIVTVEDGCKIGGLGSSVCMVANEQNYDGKIHVLGFDDAFVEHATRQEQLESAGLDIESLHILFEKLTR